MSADTVAVSGIAAGGDGVGRLADGRAVFVPRTVPGERVRLREGSLRVHRHFARGEAAEIIEPAAGRVTPACPHYIAERCGGCQLQHLSYDAQLAAKRAIIGDALRRIGKIALDDPEIEAAAEPWRYRSAIDLVVKGSGASRVVGYQPYDRPGAVFALAECHIADARLMGLWRSLKPHLHLLPERATRLTLCLDRAGARHVVVESAGEPWRTADQLRVALGDGASVVCWWQPTDGAARIVAGPTTGFPATGFDDPNPPMVRAARHWLVEVLGELRGLQVWDLYGGIGDLAVRLAERGAQVVSVDCDEKAVGWARARADLAAFGSQVRYVAGRAEDVLPSLPPPDVVIVAPPRAGLHWDVVLRLAGDPVARLAYLSRDPATLARDLHRMDVNYRIRAIRGFDLFPQTAQVGVVACLDGAAA
jgi:23S rRNA (uracil1939-C5)-methyltransferase